MKKLIIGAVVAALVLHIWQFVSWGLVNIHGAEQQYTEHQEKILEVLSENLTEGEYFLPTYKPGSSGDEIAVMAENATGKPWAVINYHPSFEMTMGMNMLRGFAINLISAFLLCWILLKFRALNFGTVIMTCVAIGLIGYFTVTYLNHIWFQGSTIGYLIDAVVGWSLVGAWLGFYLPEKNRAT